MFRAENRSGMFFGREILIHSIAKTDRKSKEKHKEKRFRSAVVLLFFFFLNDRQKKRRRKHMIIETNSASETLALGEKLGKAAKPGQIYTLNGDLGVGKTVLTQGFAKGLGITEAVNSPTFTIIQEYTEGRLPFYHFDVYRIGDIEEMEEIGYDDYFFGEGVCLIEWAELIEELIPEGAISITIEKDLEKGFDYRKITVE